MRWFLLTGLIGAMCWIFLAPTPIPFGIEIQRQLGFVGHILTFSIFSLVCFTAFPKYFWQALYILLAIAIGLETAQMLLPSRGADMMDLLMNGIGIVVGYVIFLALSLMKRAADHAKSIR